MFSLKFQYLLSLNLILFVSGQNYIKFDKVQEENELIPPIRKPLPFQILPIQRKPIVPIPIPKGKPSPQVKITSKAHPRVVTVGNSQKSFQDQVQATGASSSGPPIITIGTDPQHNLKARETLTVGKMAAATAAAAIVTSPDSSYNYQQYNAPHIHGNSGGGYSGGWGSGGDCSTCSSFDYSYRQRCCTFGHTVCCTVNSGWRPSGGHYQNSYGGYQGGSGGIGVLGFPSGGGGYNSQPGYDRWGWNNNREKPGSCYRPSYQHQPHLQWNFGGNTNGWNNANHNAGYYFQRADVGIDRDFSTGGGSGGYQGGGGGYKQHHHTGGYNHGHSTGGYGGIGILGGNSGSHYNNNNHWQQQSYCRRDFECPGNQKCCGGRCATPSFVG